MGDLPPCDTSERTTVSGEGGNSLQISKCNLLGTRCLQEMHTQSCGISAARTQVPQASLIGE